VQTSELSERETHKIKSVFSLMYGEEVENLTNDRTKKKNNTLKKGKAMATKEQGEKRGQDEGP